VTDQRATGARVVVVAVTSLAVVAWGVVGLRTGVTLDSDSLLLESTFAGVGRGDYAPSRTSGFPLYEFAGAAVWAVGGRAGVQVMALALTIIGLLLLLRPTRALRSWLGLVCWVCLALCPSVLTNASAVMETPLLLVLLAALAWVLSHSPPGDRWVAPTVALCSAALVATRPDAVLVVASTLVAVVAADVSGRRRLALALGGGAMVGLAAVVLVTSRSPFLSDYLLSEPLARRLARGAVGASTALGPVGAVGVTVLVVALLVVLVRDGVARQPGSAAPLDVPAFCALWLLATAALYGARYLMLPDEVEYLLPLMVVLAVAVPGLASGTLRALGVVTLAGLGTTSVVTVALTERTDPWQLTPQPRVSLQPGGALQDLRAREAEAVRESAGYRTFRAGSLGPLAAEVTAGRLLLRVRDRWYQAVTEKYEGTLGAAEGIVGCVQLDGRTELPGWRLSQPASAYTDVEHYLAGTPMQCGLIARLTGGGVLVEPPGATPQVPAGTTLRRGS